MPQNIGSPSNLPRFHVSQTADQLPDIRKRNAFYRAELEKQIQDKKEAERKRKEREVLEEERLLRKIEADREKLKLEYYEEIRQRELMVIKNDIKISPRFYRCGN